MFLHQDKCWKHEHVNEEHERQRVNEIVKTDNVRTLTSVARHKAIIIIRNDTMKKEREHTFLLGK